MEPVECRAVIRFLYLNGRTPRETFDEMKKTYGDDAPSYDLVKRWHREFKHGRKSVETAPRPGHPPLLLMTHLSVKLRLPFWRIDALLFAKLPKRSKLVQGLWKLSSMTICICIRCLPGGFLGCSHLFRSKNAWSAQG